MITEGFIKKDIEICGLSQFYTKEGLWSVIERPYENLYDLSLVDNDRTEVYTKLTMEEILERVNTGIE